MGQYLSSYTGKQVDSVIKKVLEGKDGIQSVSVNGTAITPDPSNNVDINVPIVSQSTGDSTTQTMSQSSITTSLSQKANISSLPTISQSTGSSTTSIMSQNAVTNALNAKASINSLSRVATSGSYSDLTNKPTIPSVSQSTGSSTTSVMSQNAVTNQLNNKVDKISGKGLSTNDYTTTEKNKLSNIESGANHTTIVQSTGSSTTSVMSQNAVTNALPTVETGDLRISLSNRMTDEGYSPTDPTYTVEYNYGKYKRIGNICFITFHIKANITNIGFGYAAVNGLPYTSDSSVSGQGIAVQEVCGSIKNLNGESVVSPITLTVMEGTKKVMIEHNNGLNATLWGTGIVWVGGTGFYFINE